LVLSKDLSSRVWVYNRPVVSTHDVNLAVIVDVRRGEDEYEASWAGFGEETPGWEHRALLWGM